MTLSFTLALHKDDPEGEIGSHIYPASYTVLTFLVRMSTKGRKEAKFQEKGTNWKLIKFGCRSWSDGSVVKRTTY